MLYSARAEFYVDGMVRIHRAFTLVELLIVIAVMGVLMALLAAAVLGSRGMARRATCMNRQHEVMLAIHQFEQAKGRFPGWREQVGTRQSPKGASWAFAILPQLSREDIYRNYTLGGAGAASQPTEQIDLYQCPEDLPGSDATALSYAVNCGMQDGAIVSRGATADRAANGMFHDADRFINANQSIVEFRKDLIRDGDRQTLAMADRCEAYSWTDAQSETRIGMIWQNTLTPRPAALINGLKPPLPESKELDHVRPSSGHDGGVVASFADGHSEFLAEDMSYLVYCLLMTPDGARARQPNGQPVLEAFRTTQLPEGVLTGE